MKEDFCDICGELREVKNRIRSIKHKHPTASKAQNKVKATITFSFVEKTKIKPFICEPCQIDVVRGASSGGEH